MLYKVIHIIFYEQKTNMHRNCKDVISKAQFVGQNYLKKPISQMDESKHFANCNLQK